MFGSKKTAGFSDQVESIIGQNTSVKGSLTSSGALRIDGQFEGDVTTTADLIVGETGVVTAQVAARNAVVAAAQITASHRLVEFVRGVGRFNK